MANFATDSTWLASILDASGVAMVGVDTQGSTVFWSRGAHALFGWAPEEVLGKAPPIVPPPLCQEWQLQMQRVLETGQPTPAAETQRLARDGRIIPVVRSASPLFGKDGSIIGLLDTLTDITVLRQLDEESRALTQVRERELIAMDLHDGLIQGLYAVLLTLDARQRGLDAAEGAARDALKSARVEIERVIEETRSYLFDLRAREFAPRDLGSGLRLLADGVRLNAQIAVELNFDAAVEPLLRPEVRGHLLYLAREAISNVLRHAQASSVKIDVARSEQRLVLSVVDDGVGFDPPNRPQRGRGLRNMAERARLVGGRLDVSTREGGGTQLKVDLPISSVSG
jgi:PAS domain S-box-containing protein